MCKRAPAKLEIQRSEPEERASVLHRDLCSVDGFANRE
jgi:hypothetical protein